MRLKAQKQAPVYGGSSSATASSVTLATVHNALDNGCGHL